MQTFRQEMQTVSKLDKLRDRPDSVTQISVLCVTGDSVSIEWKPPKSYGSEIVAYRIYMDSKNVSNKGDTWRHRDQMPKASNLTLLSETTETTFMFKDLDPSTGYYFHITALNEYGESYKPERPMFIQTLKSDQSC